MAKKIFIALGAMAFLVAMALNLNHAANDYGLKTNSLWTTVAASTTSTGNSSGTGNEPVFCIWQQCIGGQGNCHTEIECYWHFDTEHNISFLSCNSIEICDSYFVGRKYECSISQPSHYNWIWGNSCSDCNQTCVETSTTTS